MKDELFNRDTCTSCLDICPPNKAFFAFIAQTVRAADYEFEGFSHWKTLPASIILRQFGLWVHMRDKFPNVPFYQQASFENNIVELKEALKFSQPAMITAEINRLRAIDNGSVQGDVATVYAEDAAADYAGVARSPYSVQPEQPGAPDMHVSRHDINKGKAFCAALAPFKVHTVFHTERPEYEGELRAHMARLHAHRGKNEKRSQGDVMSTSGNLTRNLGKLPVDTLRAVGVVPPTLPSRAVSLDQATGGFIRNRRKRREARQQVRSEQEQARAPQEDAGEDFVPLPLDGIPLSIAASLDASNGVPPGRVLQLSPYVTVEVSCQHNNVLLEGSYLKLSRLISHSSWYENPAHAPEGLVEPAPAPREPAADEQSPVRKKKRFEDLEDSEDEEEAQNALNALLTRKDDDDSNVFAESSVEAEIAHRALPHFRPGNGLGYVEFGRDGRGAYERGSLVPTGVNPYAVLQYAGYAFKFHSSGREDLNVRMLGNGRPFFLEVVDPHRAPRLTPAVLAALQEEINAHSTLVQVRGLREGDAKSFATMVKGIGEKRKRYRCIVHCTRRLADDDALTPLNTAGDLNITQLTPIRVLFRRAALARSRHVNNLRARRLNDHWFVLDLETQAGTYVKEFVHSDRGRTFPSVTSLLGAQCSIIQLDVTELIL
jgi:tRNA pseudouridine(54/55) synthase